MAGIKDNPSVPESLSGEAPDKSRQPEPWFTQELKDQLFPPLENMRVPPKERRKIYMAEGDLGEMMPLGGQPTAGGSPAAGGASQPRSWASMVSDPVVSAGMLAAGLSMMRGGYGTMGQQMAQAGSEGMTAAGNTAGHILENQRYEQKQADTKSEKAADRASHEKIANIQSEGRIEAKRIGGEYSLERAQLALQKAGSNISAKYLGEARKIVENSIQNIQMDDQTKTQLIMRKAAELYQNDADRGLVPAPTASGAPPTQTSGTPGASPPATQAATTAKGPPKPSWDQIKDTPIVKKLMQTPAGKRTLLNERPDLEAEILKDVPIYGN